jgi:NADH dehydrogenase (ubiquinone) Fe-S protein 3
MLPEYLSNILKKTYKNVNINLEIMSINQLVIAYSQYLLKCCLKSITKVQIKQNLMTLSILRKDLVPICTFLKNHTNTQFKTLLDIVVVDYPLRKNRFEVIYVFLSMSRNTRLLLKSQLTTLSSISSITQLYSAAC